MAEQDFMNKRTFYHFIMGASPQTPGV